VKRLCSIDGCDRQHDARGWCQVHYNNWRSRGDPLTEADDPDRIPWCECAEPSPIPGPLTWGAILNGPLPGQCTNCGGLVYEALAASVAARREASAA